MNPTTYFTTLPSPVGDLVLTSNGKALTGLHFSTGNKAKSAEPHWQRAEELFVEAKTQLQQYFTGQRSQFDLDLAPPGTDFQRSVLQALQEIPYGETRSYLDIAQRIGKPKAVRAVGGANGNNPIAVIIPCHRVIGSNGTLTGFGGGLDAKRFLLNLETRQSQLFAS